MTPRQVLFTQQLIRHERGREESFHTYGFFGRVPSLLGGGSAGRNHASPRVLAIAMTCTYGVARVHLFTKVYEVF